MSDRLVTVQQVAVCVGDSGIYSEVVFNAVTTHALLQVHIYLSWMNKPLMIAQSILWFLSLS